MPAAAFAFLKPGRNFCGNRNAACSGTIFVTPNGSFCSPQIRIASVIGIAITPPATTPIIWPRPPACFRGAALARRGAAAAAVAAAATGTTAAAPAAGSEKSKPPASASALASASAGVSVAT
jgi:hypothetical protein